MRRTAVYAFFYQCGDRQCKIICKLRLSANIGQGLLYTEVLALVQRAVQHYDMRYGALINLMLCAAVFFVQPTAPLQY